MCCLIFKIEYCGGVDGISHEACLKMEVRTGWASCIAAKSDGIAGFNIVVGFHEEAWQVSVHCFKSVFVTHDHIVSVASAFIAGETHLAVKRGTDGVAYLHFEVDPLVHTAETTAIAVGWSHISRSGHGEIGYVDHLWVGHDWIGVGVDELAVPTFGIYV